MTFSEVLSVLFPHVLVNIIQNYIAQKQLVQTQVSFAKVICQFMGLRMWYAAEKPSRYQTLSRYCSCVSMFGIPLITNHEMSLGFFKTPYSRHSSRVIYYWIDVYTREDNFVFSV